MAFSPRSAEGSLTHQEFWNAAGVEGKLDVVKHCIEELGFPVDLRDPKENDTPLIKAAYFAKYDIAEYLLTKGADVNAVDNSMGFTALHFAVYRGTFNHIRLVKLLLDNGADASIMSKKDDNWELKARSVYDAAVQKGNKHIISILEERGITS